MTLANAKITRVDTETAQFSDGTTVVRQRPALAPWYNELVGGKMLTRQGFHVVFRTGEFAADAVIRLGRQEYDGAADGALGTLQYKQRKNEPEKSS